MRRLYKSKEIPPSLQNLLPPESEADIKPELYKGKDIKDTLCQDQHSKCAYCECRLNGDFGHIEHFRPKAGYSVPPAEICTSQVTTGSLMIGKTYS